MQFYSPYKELLMFGENQTLLKKKNLVQECNFLSLITYIKTQFFKDMKFGLNKALNEMSKLML